jgi:DNA-binding IclR family transcriptional regulator
MTVVEAEPAGRRDGGQISAVAKALTVLDGFDGAAAAIGVSEVARRVGLSKSTVFRLLSSLEAQGYVERRGVNYCLGPRLFELGNQVPWCRPRSLRDTALPHLCELFTATRRTVHLAVLDGLDVLFVDKLQGRERPSTLTRVGARLSARNTAIGKAMLAFAPREHIERAARAVPTQRTPYSIVSPAVLVRELETVRRTGVAFDREEAQVGMSCVGAPVMHRNLVVGAISITGTCTSFDPEHFAGRVRSAADAIAADLR